MKLTPTDALNYRDIYNMEHDIRNQGCSGCDLGSQIDIKAPVLRRGNITAPVVCIGGGPEKEEDISGITFTGPAGQLLDKIFTAAGIDSNLDCYLCNIVNCRPITPKNSGKQNKPPTVKQVKACAPWLQAQLQIINPQCIVLVGMSAVKGYLSPDIIGNKAMIEFAGQVLKEDPLVFALYHPNVILHLQQIPDRQFWYKKEMWKHIQKLKIELTKRGIL